MPASGITSAKAHTLQEVAKTRIFPLPSAWGFVAILDPLAGSPPTLFEGGADPAPGCPRTPGRWLGGLTCGPVKAVCKALSVQRLDADLLALTEIDRDTGTIWFLYNKPLTTREELPGELHRLQSLGWIERTPKDRRLITSAGSEALSAARNWVFQVDQISQDEEYGRHATVIGRLLAGSMTFFAHPFCNGFTIKRDDARREPAGSTTLDRPMIQQVHTWSSHWNSSDDGRFRRGDLLRFRQQWVG